MYSGTSLLRTLWDLKFSLYYRGFLNSEVILYTTVLHWDTEWCPYYRGFLISEVCNREVPLYDPFLEMILVIYIFPVYCFHPRRVFGLGGFEFTPLSGRTLSPSSNQSINNNNIIVIIPICHNFIIMNIIIITNFN